jgi:methenyltetrahydromethanopterin cyclohydrolase
MLTMKAPEIKDYLERIPTISPKDTENRSMKSQEAQFDFYKIDTSLFSPPKLSSTNLRMA